MWQKEERAKDWSYSPPKERANTEQRQDRAAGNVHLEAEEAAEPEAQSRNHRGEQMEFGRRRTIWVGAEPDVPTRTEGDSLPGVSSTGSEWDVVEGAQEDVRKFSSQPACGGPAGLLRSGTFE